MPDFKTMIKGMEEKETPTQEETEKAGKLADSGFKIGEHRFIGKDNNKANPGFIAYGGNNPDQKLSTKELAKIYDEQQKVKSVPPEQDRLTKLKKDAIAESQATAQKEAPLAGKFHLNIPSHKPTTKELDKEVTDMFKSREEANKWLEENKGGMSEEDIANAKARFDRAFGSSPLAEKPKPSKEPMPFGMKKRMEDEVSVHNGQQPKGGQQMPKKDYSHLDDRELYAQINLAENEEEYNDLLAEKERRWQESKKNQPQAKKEAPLAGGDRLFNEYGIATKEGEKASADFKREKGIKNYYSLTNEQFNELAKEAMQKYGIKDLELAQEFLISNEESDRDWEKLPKQGSFKEAVKDMDKPEQDLGDFNPSEPIDDYQSGAKTHSENEFRIEALNDSGMYDFITKNRDYLYRKANSDPQGAVKDIISRASGNYSIKPENIRKDFVMDVLKSFYEDDEGQIPDFNKPEEFNPSDKIEEFNDYYGAKTASERNFNLMTGNDRGAYDYVTQNRDALAKEAEYDPASVLQKIKWHAENRNWARELKPDSIRKDYLINVIKGIIED